MDLLEIISNLPKYDYTLYQTECAKLNKPVVNIAMFAETVGIYIVATSTYPALNYRDAIRTLHATNAMNHEALIRKVQQGGVEIKSCCGGGTVK